MNRLMLGIGAAALATAVVNGQETKIATFDTFLQAPLELKTLKGAPYSAETVSEFMQTLADGNRIVRRATGRVYRDSEGRIRREEDRATGSTAISITDPVVGVSYSLDPERRIAWKTPSFAGMIIMNTMDDRDAPRSGRPLFVPEGASGPMTMELNGGRIAIRRSGDGEQRNAETLPPKPIEGIVADGRRITTTIPAGSIGNERAITVVTEEWTSPELQVLVLTEHRDPRSGDSSYRLLNINRGEPSPSLFEVPSDYTIRETGIRKFEYQ
jgi:hypothetical protein